MVSSFALVVTWVTWVMLCEGVEGLERSQAASGGRLPRCEPATGSPPNNSGHRSRRRTHNVQSSRTGCLDVLKLSAAQDKSDETSPTLGMIASPVPVLVYTNVPAVFRMYVPAAGNEAWARAVGANEVVCLRFALLEVLFGCR